jgi:hypothetical protein
MSNSKGRRLSPIGRQRAGFLSAHSTCLVVPERLPVLDRLRCEGGAKQQVLERRYFSQGDRRS